MISLVSKLTLESKVLPGAVVHLKKFNVQQRAQITLQLAEYRAKLNDVYRRMIETIPILNETDETGAVTKPGDPADVIERKSLQRAGLHNEIAAITDAYIKPALLRHYIVGVEGVEIDGEPLTAETVVTKAPPEFGDEIYSFIEEHNGLPPFAGSSSASPSHSPTAEDGSSPITTAAGVKS